MDLTDFSTLRTLLKKYRIWAQKRLGQNFLIDRTVLEDIITAADIQLEETIVEIGPGPGVLTQALLKAGAEVEAVEIDASVFPALKEATHFWRDRLQLFHTHVLNYTPPPKPYKLVANIPYYLTSPILRKFLNEVEHRPKIIVLMIQKEVAEKICAPAGSDSHLSLMVKIHGKPQIMRVVPPESFFPVPKVASAILKIELFPAPHLTIPGKIFEEMLFAGFAEPRKKLANVLSHKFAKPSEEIREILNSVHISGDLRAQNLTIEEWESLAKIFFEKYL